MAVESLGFDIFARDRASATFTKVGNSVDKTQSKFSKFSGALKAGAVVAGAALFKLGKDAVGNASDLGETINKSEVIFGKNFATMDKWAKGAATNMGLSRQAALASAAGFGDMFTQLGFAGAESAKMSKAVVQMSADLGSFNNLPTSEVTEMMSAAFRGEYDSLQRLIPNINAARVETQALAMTGKSAASELTAQEKAAATLAIVQKDGARATGDFARTSGGLANQTKILKARYEDVSAEVGTKLIPVMTKVVGWIGKAVTFTQKHSDVLGPLAAAVGIATVAIWGINLAMAANPVGLVVAGIALLVAGLVIAYKKSETFRNAVNTSWGALKVLGKFISGPLFGYLKMLGSLWLTMAIFGVKAFRTLLTAAFTVFGGILKAAEKGLGWIPGIGGKIKTARRAFENFRDGTVSALDKVERGLRKTRDAVNGVPTKKNVNINANTKAAERRVMALKRRIGEVPVSKTVTITVATKTIGKNISKLIPFAGGGTVTGIGGPRDDNQLVLASVGEEIINARSAAKHRSLLKAINADKFADGGTVGPAVAARSSSNGGGDIYITHITTLDGKEVHRSLLRYERTTGKQILVRS